MNQLSQELTARGAYSKIRSLVLAPPHSPPLPPRDRGWSMVNYFYQPHLCNKSQIIIFINHTYIIKAERAWFRELPDCLARTVLSSLWSWLQGGEPPPPFQTRARVSQSALWGPLSWDVLPPSSVVARKKQPQRESTMPSKQLKVNHSQQLPLLFI